MDRIEQLQKMIEQDPEDSFLLFALAKEWSNQAEFQEAITLFLKLKEKNPDYIGCYYHLAKCYEEIDDTEAAKSVYQEGISMASRLNDQHAKSELQNALVNLTMGL